MKGKQLRHKDFQKIETKHDEKVGIVLSLNTKHENQGQEHKIVQMEFYYEKMKITNIIM
jgi:2-oxoglutarate dehydrogenase complex dehydrogenase (E1) component-like enzyme